MGGIRQKYIFYFFDETLKKIVGRLSQKKLIFIRALYFCGGGDTKQKREIIPVEGESLQKSDLLS